MCVNDCQSFPCAPTLANASGEPQSTWLTMICGRPPTIAPRIVHANFRDGARISGTRMNGAFCGRTAQANPTASPMAKFVSTPSRRRIDSHTTAAHAAAPTACDIVACRSEYHISGDPNQMAIAAMNALFLRGADVSSALADRADETSAPLKPSSNAISPATALVKTTGTLYGSETPSALLASACPSRYDGNHAIALPQVQ